MSDLMSLDELITYLRGVVSEEDVDKATALAIELAELVSCKMLGDATCEIEIEHIQAQALNLAAENRIELQNAFQKWLGDFVKVLLQAALSAA